MSAIDLDEYAFWYRLLSTELRKDEKDRPGKVGAYRALTVLTQLHGATEGNRRFLAYLAHHLDEPVKGSNDPSPASKVSREK